MLVRHAMGVDRAQFFVALSDAVSPDIRHAALACARRRAEGEPLAYITGRREFYGLDLHVDRRVLVPRQETETLVDCVIEHCAALEGAGDVRVVDVGTGSGAIAIAVAVRVPRAQVIAIDADAGALEVADANRRRHGVDGHVSLARGDLLAPLAGPVDVIVSNPPYIRSADMARLPREVRREPAGALDGGVDGLVVVRRLLEDAPRRLKSGGGLFVEIAPEQLGEVQELAGRSFPEGSVTHREDALGLPRVVCVYAG